MCIVAASLAATASPVAPDLAAAAARGFALRGRTLGARIGMFAEKTARHVSEDGHAFFAVKMFGGGTVFLAGDTSLSPVVAFTSSSEDYSEIDHESPLWALLSRGMKCRASVPLAATSHDGASEWTALAEDGAEPLSLSPLAVASISSPDDICVGALVQSQWGQQTARGQLCYNYYTPSNSYCGCIATAAGQIMRYHSWPERSVQPRTSSNCLYGETASAALPVTLSMQGGTYDWDDMPLVPATYSALSETNRRAIGKLISDIGIASNMMYTRLNGSFAFSIIAHDAFVNVFGYAQAKTLIYDDVGGFTANNLRKTILSNLDAGFPVIIGISTSSGARHAVVVDGYGFSGDLAFVHVNLGWEGQYDTWYNLPEISTPPYLFNSVEEAIYNIMPTGTGAILSGRVTNGSQGVSGAVVTARSFRTTATTHTSSSGVYAFVLPQGTYRVEAVSADGRITNSLSSVVLTAPSESTRTYSISPTASYSYQYTAKVVSRESDIGNSWGNDIVLMVDSVALDVIGPPYEDGVAPSLSPAAGSISHVCGEPITLRADAFMEITNENGVVCARRPLIGFTGTGSIPSHGTTNEITVVLSEDSSITWIYAAAPSHYRVREWELYSGWYVYEALYDAFIDFVGPVRDWWCEADSGTSLFLPGDASRGDSFVRENVSYHRGDPTAQELGTLRFKLSSVILYDLLYEYNLENGYYVLDDNNHYAMPRVLVLGGDRAYDIVWEYLPTIDLTESGLPRWWYNRYLQGAVWYNIIGSDNCLPGADPDGDGRNNLRESRDETDPLDPLSCFYPLLINLR